MRVVVAVVWLAAAAAALQINLNAEEKQAMEKATPEQKNAIVKMLEELAKNGQEVVAKAPQRDGTMVKWHSMSEVRRLQSDGRKLVIVRIEPIDSDGFERRLEVVAAELRARGAEEATWVKRVVPADDDAMWMHWEGVPSTTQVFIITGVPEERAKIYKGSDSFTDMLTWLLKYLPPPKPKEIKTEEEMDQFMMAAPVSVIAYVPREMSIDRSFHAFVKRIAQRHPYLPVGMVYPAEELPYPRHTLAPIAIYYRDEDHVFPLDEDRLREMDDFTRDNALKKASHQFISRFPDDAVHIFSQGIDKIVFVFDVVGEGRGQTPSYLRELALEMRQRVVIAYVDAKDARMNGVRVFFGVQDSKAVRGFDARTERQYWPERPQGVAFPHEVQAFVRDLAANKLTPHRKVEKIDPELNDLATIKLNADTFETIALDPAGDTVVVFYATWCPHSKRFLEKFIRAGHESVGKRKVLFAILDVEKNDVETKNKIRLFPTVILFRKNTNEEVVFVGRRNLREFLQWLDEEVDRQPKNEEPEVEVDETAKDYESPLKKKVKHDPEQQYTLDGLESVSIDEKKGGKRMKLTEGMGGLQDQLAERVLEKLKVDRPTIAGALERARDWRKADEEKEKRSTVEKKEKDTVEKATKDTVEEKKKKGAVEEKKKDSVEKKKKDNVEEKKKETVEEKKKDTVEEKARVTVEEKKKDTVMKKEVVEEKKEEQPPKEKIPPPAAKKSTVVQIVEEQMDTVESTVVDTPDKKESTVDPPEVPKKIVVEKQSPVKSEL